MHFHADISVILLGWFGEIPDSALLAEFFRTCVKDLRTSSSAAAAGHFTFYNAPAVNNITEICAGRRDPDH